MVGQPCGKGARIDEALRDFTVALHLNRDLHVKLEFSTTIFQQWRCCRIGQSPSVSVLGQRDTRRSARFYKISKHRIEKGDERIEARQRLDCTSLHHLTESANNLYVKTPRTRAFGADGQIWGYLVFWLENRGHSLP